MLRKRVFLFLNSCNVQMHAVRTWATTLMRALGDPILLFCCRSFCFSVLTWLGQKTQLGGLRGRRRRRGAGALATHMHARFNSLTTCLFAVAQASATLYPVTASLLASFQKIAGARCICCCCSLGFIHESLIGCFETVHV